MAVDELLKSKLEARAKILKAMAHASRLYVLEMLAERERCVCELTDAIGADTSTVSKHLSILKEAGLVDTDKRGTQVYYRIAMPCVLNFFGCVENVLRAKAENHLRIL